MIALLGYIDPSSGSLFLQMVIGTVLAVVYAIRHQISRWWHRLTKRNSSSGHGLKAKPDKPEDEA
jgi:hypothetical protein